MCFGPNAFTLYRMQEKYAYLKDEADELLKTLNFGSSDLEVEKYLSLRKTYLYKIGRRWKFEKHSTKGAK